MDVEALATATYRRGDVVLLKITESLNDSEIARCRRLLEPIEETTGVRFVLIGKGIEVVEPVPASL